MLEEAGEYKISSIPPKWYMWVAVAGLVWNLLGVVAFLIQLTMDLSELPEAQRAFHEGTPTWATASFALAVFSGVLGCIGLLMRKTWALLMFILCLIGILLQNLQSLVLSNGLEVFGWTGSILAILTLSICLLLIWFSRYSKAQGWLEG